MTAKTKFERIAVDCIAKKISKARKLHALCRASIRPIIGGIANAGLAYFFDIPGKNIRAVVTICD
jgi:hypothetical protein